MNYRLRLPLVMRALFVALGFSLPLHAQHSLVYPLPADPSRLALASGMAARGTAVLALPFFEDFAGQRQGSPSPDRWEATGGALVNERFAATPPSRGVVTFDGLNAQGQPYGSASAYNFTDTLTSQPINLGGLAPGDRTFLSFFWQAGSIVGAPSSFGNGRPILLQLEFLDNTGRWVKVWEKRSQGARTEFQQRFIAVSEARYLHPGFRFRFRNSGSLAGTRDSWNLDYLVLDRNRDTTNVSYADLALSKPLNSLLKRYAAMPVWQYNAAPNPSQELNDSASTTLNNLDAGAVPPTPVTWEGYVQVLPSGSRSRFLTGNNTFAPGTRQEYIGGTLRNTPLPVSSQPKRVRHSIYLLTNSTNPRTLANDTVTRITELDNYFAYDDGTAEGTNALRQNETRATFRAVRFMNNIGDQVRSIRFYYTGANAPNQASLPPTITLTFLVWDADASGLPRAQAKASKTVVLSTTPAGGGGYQEVVFDQPVPVGSMFFIGYSQPATSLFVQFGADLNSRQPTNTFFDNETGSWAVFTNRTFVPMLHPYMTGVVTSSRPRQTDALIQVYPNPSTGMVQVAGRYDSAELVDALGRRVWQQPVGTTGKPLDLRQVSAGVYLLRLHLPDGSASTHRLVLQP